MREEIPHNFNNICPINEISKGKFFNLEREEFCWFPCSRRYLRKLFLSSQSKSSSTAERILTVKEVSSERKNRILCLSVFLLVDQEQVVRKSLTGLLTVLRVNYLLNFCSKKEKEMWRELLKVLQLLFQCTSGAW